MSSNPTLSNGKPPVPKPPGKPRKAKKPPKSEPKKVTVTEAAGTAQPAKMVQAAPAAAPAPVDSEPLPIKPQPAPKPSVKPAKPAKPTLDSAVEGFERSFKAAGEGAMAMHAKLCDIARQNVTCGLDFMSALAAVKHPADAVRLQMSFWDERMRALLGQARELRTLSAETIAKANEPLRAQVKWGFPAKAA